MAQVQILTKHLPSVVSANLPLVVPPAPVLLRSARA